LQIVDAQYRITRHVLRNERSDNNLWRIEELNLATLRWTFRPGGQRTSVCPQASHATGSVNGNDL
jgi:hypothetical protein